MSIQVQYRRGTNAENDAFTGALAEITVDTTNGSLRVHDGFTSGGSPLIAAAATQTLTNKTYNGVLVSVTGSVTGGNLLTGGNVSATGNVTGGNVLFGSGIVSGTGNITGGNISATSHTGSVISVSGNITGANVNTTVASVTGNVIAGNVTTAGIITVNSGDAVTAIVNGGSNAVGNIGSSTTYFNRLYAQATTALYADLAEMYTSDAEYSPGTVLVFGGNNEVTVSTESHDVKIAGVVSTHPAHVMNSGLQGEHTVAVALTGRVPCQVTGPITKGDRLVSSNTPGVAQRLDMAQYQPGQIIGKALEDYTGAEPGVIEVVVGRL